MQATPPSRLIAGLVLFFACMAVDAATCNGIIFSSMVVVSWWFVCRPPLTILRNSFLLGLILFLPYFLLVPWLINISSETITNWSAALQTPWLILFRGLCVMLIAITTCTSLSAGDLREALLKLPIPAIISVILIQIIHQSAVLFYETKRVAAAMAVRGATKGIRNACKMFVYLPQVWLPRVIMRAERIAAAMELRGYCQLSTQKFYKARSKRDLNKFDLSILSFAIIALLISISLRILVMM